MSTARAITNQITNDDYLRKQIFRVLLSILIILSLGYMYIIGSITFNVLARRSLSNSEIQKGNVVGQLELKYVALSNSINESYGTAHGFVEPSGMLFASRDTTSVVAMR